MPPSSPGIEGIGRWAALLRAEGIGSATLLGLVGALGGIAEVWSASIDRLAAVRGMGGDRARLLVEARRRADPGAEEQALRDRGLGAVSWEHPDYPPPLRFIPDPPALLYYQGTLPDWSRAAAIVGTRTATPYGLRTARSLGRHLARRSVVLVSGMALGIDGAAHLGVLDGDGLTVAVLGSGLDHPSPASHRRLCQRIAERGAVLSEYPPDLEPQPHQFPRRNRLISGLSQVVVVVEAPLKSGALHTVDHALAQGKEVLAVPGPVDSVQSEGTNRLIRDGARPLLDWDEIGDEWGWPAARPVGQAALSDVERSVLEALGGAPRRPDQLATRTGLAIPEITATLVVLELKSFVRAIEQGSYVRSVVPDPALEGKGGGPLGKDSDPFSVEDD